LTHAAHQWWRNPRHRARIIRQLIYGVLARPNKTPDAADLAKDRRIHRVRRMVTIERHRCERAIRHSKACRRIPTVTNPSIDELRVRCQLKLVHDRCQPSARGELNRTVLSSMTRCQRSALRLQRNCQGGRRRFIWRSIKWVCESPRHTRRSRARPQHGPSKSISKLATNHFRRHSMAVFDAARSRVIHNYARPMTCTENCPCGDEKRVINRIG